MSDKSTQKRPWYAFAKKQRTTVSKKLDTGVIVERTKIGSVENIHVIDAEVVEVVKRPSFFISETIFKTLGLWRRN